MKVVADSSVLINLCKISRLDLLKHFQVLIPEAVLREVVEEGKGREGVEEVKKAGFEVRKISDLKLYNLLRAYLDAGESEAITLASEVNAIVLLDEKDARSLAEKLGLKVMGTVGLLIWAKKAGYIDSLREELDKLIDGLCMFEKERAEKFYELTEGIDFDEFAKRKQKL